jgi:hypothetical protein
MYSNSDQVLPSPMKFHQTLPRLQIFTLANHDSSELPIQTCLEMTSHLSIINSNSNKKFFHFPLPKRIVVSFPWPHWGLIPAFTVRFCKNMLHLYIHLHPHVELYTPPRTQTRYHWFCIPNVKMEKIINQNVSRNELNFFCLVLHFNQL